MSRKSTKSGLTYHKHNKLAALYQQWEGHESEADYHQSHANDIARQIESEFGIDVYNPPQWLQE